jgi:hypothetical protein
VQAGRDRELGRRTCRQYSVVGFEDGLGEFFDEKRHAVGAFDDLVNGFRGEAGIAGEPFDQHRAVVSGKPVSSPAG